MSTDTAERCEAEDLVKAVAEAMHRRYYGSLGWLACDPRWPSLHVSCGEIPAGASADDVHRHLLKLAGEMEAAAADLRQAIVATMPTVPTDAAWRAWFLSVDAILGEVHAAIYRAGGPVCLGLREETFVPDDPRGVEVHCVPLGSTWIPVGADRRQVLALLRELLGEAGEAVEGARQAIEDLCSADVSGELATAGAE